MRESVIRKQEIRDVAASSVSKCRQFLLMVVFYYKDKPSYLKNMGAFIAIQIASEFNKRRRRFLIESKFQDGECNEGSNGNHKLFVGSTDIMYVSLSLRNISLYCFQQLPMVYYHTILSTISYENIEETSQIVAPPTYFVLRLPKLFEQENYKRETSAVI